MARVGGRNTLFAWAVGLGCAAVVGALVWIAAPLVPASLAFIDQAVTPPTSDPVAADDDTVPGAPGECRDLYSDALWAALRWAPEATLVPSSDAPATSASGLVDALAPQVQFTCTWTSELGTVSTTLATAPTDAGAIAETALPAQGFTCDDVGERVRCVQSADGRVETIEAGGGLWLSTVLDQWHPEQYTTRIADRVWAD